MFGSIKRSWQLTKESYRVLSHDPELIFLMGMSMLGCGIIAGVIGISVLALDGLGLTQYLLLGLGYYAGYFIIIYFQVALVSSVQLRISGGDPTVWYGINRANHRIAPILTWSLIAATVGLILDLLFKAARTQHNIWGRIIGMILIGVLGGAWNLLVFFVIPVIAAEGIGGFGALKRSKAIITGNYGEAILGGFGISIIGILAAIAVAIPLALLWILFGHNILVAGVLIGLALIAFVGIACATSALDGTFRAVLYDYKKTGNLGGFSSDTLDSAILSK
jgi:hypothetical protein